MVAVGGVLSVIEFYGGVVQVGPDVISCKIFLVQFFNIKLESEKIFNFFFERFRLEGIDVDPVLKKYKTELAEGEKKKSSISV